jgi:poly(3-hydroxybutyrate) depolymerase
MNIRSAGRSVDRHPGAATVASDRAAFEPGEPVWVMEANGAQRPAEYLGARVMSVWRGGPPMVFVLYTGSHSAEAVEMDRVIPRRTTA